ncbi:hypothetical protein O181_021577 [Austropuccinia psidii MF-1]|uniref:Secreted protein n=1 Tax=Austropuccinia psidii MF-1 TaxID=1389203 RepID=A0A9Q3CFS8_9BASI|nr:hypothetical protein [Austropuccinia psidii MF-1]
MFSNHLSFWVFSSALAVILTDALAKPKGSELDNISFTKLGCLNEYRPKGLELAVCGDGQNRTFCIIDYCYVTLPGPQDAPHQSVGNDLFFHHCHEVSRRTNTFAKVLAQKYLVNTTTNMIFIGNGTAAETGKPLPDKGVECPLKDQENGLRVLCDKCIHPS